MISMNVPSGACVYCGATGVFQVGRGGTAPTMIWTLPSGETCVEENAPASNASRCPRCHERLTAERAARDEAWKRNPSLDEPVAESSKKNGKKNGTHR